MVLAVVGLLLTAVALAAWSRGARTGADDGIRVLDPVGATVVVDRVSGGGERLLSILRRHGVDAPRLVVFREPVPDGVADALDARFGPHVRWGPPGSVASATPLDGQRFRADGTTWEVHIRSGRLLVRRVPEALGSAPSEPLDGAPRGRQPARVPSAG